MGRLLVFGFVVLFSGCYDVHRVQDLALDVDKVSQAVSDVSTAVAAVEVDSADRISSTLELIKAGNDASRPFNPYSPLIDAGLTGLAGLAGAFAVYKGRKAKVAEVKYSAHRHGVERTLRELGTRPSESVNRELVDDLLYKNIGEARKG